MSDTDDDEYCKKVKIDKNIDKPKHHKNNKGKISEPATAKEQDPYDLFDQSISARKIVKVDWL